jgi:hypothetical protein
MRNKRKWGVLLMGILGLSLMVTLLTPPSVNAQIVEPFKNLQIMPKNSTKMDVMNVMQDMTFAVGTRCSYCHVGEGDDLSTFDFASDARPGKEITRVMMRMTDDMNNNYLAEIDSEGEVTCLMCHQGQLKPEE